MTPKELYAERIAVLTEEIRQQNMTGKSTFLRSIGINYVLATCGMTVFADSLRVSLFSLFSSRRTTDDLAHGISYCFEITNEREKSDACICSSERGGIRRSQIQLSDEITYTYRLTEGVARNQNATYLLKSILKSALR